MTHARVSSLLLSSAADLPVAANGDEEHPLVDALRGELDEVEPVISAAVLAVTAFRLRDESGLVSALRGLSEAVSAFEHARAED
jgi:hypothetical protein